MHLIDLALNDDTAPTLEAAIFDFVADTGGQVELHALRHLEPRNVFPGTEIVLRGTGNILAGTEIILPGTPQHLSGLSENLVTEHKAPGNSRSVRQSDKKRRQTMQEDKEMIQDEVGNENVKRWMETAKALSDEETPSQGKPVAVCLDEGVVAARMMETYWTPAPEKSLPGLVSVEKVLPQALREEIISLVEAARHLQSLVLLPGVTDSAAQEQIDRARKVAAELRSHLVFLLEGGSTEAADLALVAARERETENGSLPTLAQALWDYATLAEKVSDRLVESCGFEPALIEEARSLSRAISAIGAQQPGRPASPWVDLRNRMLYLLEQRVGLVRRAVSFVFRNHPSIMRQATSAYERRRRAAAKKRKPEAEVVEPDEASVAS